MEHSELLKILTSNTNTVHIKSLNASIRYHNYKGQNIVVKQYNDTDSALERFERESYFLKFCLSNGIFEVPRILASDSNLGVIAMSYLPGDIVVVQNNEDIDQYSRFLNKLNGSDLADIYQLNAKDALLKEVSVDLDIEKRYEALYRAGGGREFLFLLDLIMCRNQEYTKYNEILRDFVSLKELQRDPIVSPSDVGFHNCLKQSGKLFFFDFEYAGLDSSIKTIFDFVNQPRFRLTLTQVGRFIDGTYLLHGLKLDEIPIEIWFLFRAKWALIVLAAAQKMNARQGFEPYDKIQLAKSYLDENISFGGSGG